MSAAILPVAGAIGTSLFGRRSARGATERSSEERGALTSLTGLADQLGTQGSQLFNFGLPQLQRSGRFFSDILGGSRTAAAAATTPERNRITDIFRGAESGIRRTSRGGVRDLALAETSRSRAESLASLIPSIRTGAASAAGSLGLGATGTGVGATRAGGGLFANLLGQGQQNRFLGEEVQNRAGGDLGGLLFQILQSGGKSGGGSQGATTGGLTSPSMGDLARVS